MVMCGQSSSSGDVSIHAPRIGRDPRNRTPTSRLECFNPRAPHRARYRQQRGRHLLLCFNPRAPHRARCRTRASPATARCFNPRAPHRARWPPPRSTSSTGGGFNPRAPHRARSGRHGVQRRLSGFNPRAPHRARWPNRVHCSGGLLFQSTRPA